MSRRLHLSTALLPLLAASVASASPGDLDNAFNNGSGFIAIAAPTGAVQPIGTALCLDSLQRIVVSASLKQSATTDLWQAQLLRLSPAGVPDTAFAPSNWRPVGTPAVQPQQPSLLCAGDRYVLNSIGGTSPFSVALDQVPAHPGGFAPTSTALPALSARSARIALASLTAGQWWTGPMVASPPQSQLRRFDGTGSTLVHAATAFGVSGLQSQFTDAFFTPQGQLYAVGRKTDASGFSAYVQSFNNNGLQNTSFATAGTFSWNTAWDDYGQRIIPAPNGALYVGLTEIAPGAADSVLRVLRLTGSGAVDPTFGNTSGNGFLLADAQLGDLAIDSQGRLLVAGAQEHVGFVRRLLSSGAPDLSFGPDGERRYGFGSLTSFFNGIALDASGRIVVTGRRDSAQRGGLVVPEALIVARLLP